MRYTPSYDAIKEARRADDDLNRGQWTRDLKVSNWRRVIELTVETLSSKSKDLQIAAWLTEALTIHNGFAGLRGGICLLRMLHERFWDSLYPALEDGDAELRAGILEWLNDRLPPLIRAIPLTAPDGVGPYSWLRWQESRAVEEAGRKKAQDKAALVAEGKITGEQFDKAVAASPQKLLEELLEDIRESFDENQKLAEQVDDRYGRDAPSLIGIKQALEDCRALVEDLLKKKQAPAAAPAQPPAAATAPNAPKPPPGAAPAAAPAQVRPAAPSPPAAQSTTPPAAQPPPPAAPATPASSTIAASPTLAQPQASAPPAPPAPQAQIAAAPVTPGPQPQSPISQAAGPAQSPSASPAPNQVSAGQPQAPGNVSNRPQPAVNGATPASPPQSAPLVAINPHRPEVSQLQPANQAAAAIPAGALPLEPRDRADALRRLQSIAAYFQRTEPQSPVSYLVQRAVRWGEMPLDQWLNDVISDKAVLAHIRETLGLKSSP